MVSAAFPSSLGSVGKKEKVVHSLLHDHVDEVTNGGSFTDRIGAMMHCATSWRRVFENLQGVNTIKIVFTRSPSLAERNQIRLKSV